MFLSDVSIKRPVFATMMIGALLLFGFISRQRMGVDLYPNIDFPIVTVTATLEGASPEVVETEVTDPLEDAISSVEGVRHITSHSSQSVSQVIIEFELETDIDIAAQDVRDKISRAQYTLPKDMDPPVIGKVDISARPIMWLSVSGTMGKLELSMIAEDVVKPMLETLPGVGNIFLPGLRKREVRIWLDARKMEAYHVTAEEVKQALLTKNIEIPAGKIENPVRELTVRTMGEFQSPAEFNSLIITFREGSPVRLSDVGVAEDGMEDKRSLGRFQGEPTIGMGIVPRSGANNVEVANRIKEKLKEIQRVVPQIKIDTCYDSSTFIKQSIADVQFDLLYGAFLAALVIFLFLRTIRATLIIALAIPTSLIGSFCVMHALGFTINSMTMLALSLCVGLVVDDAIVVLENIFRHAEMGKPPVQAAHEGTSEIAFAATAATLSIVAVFLPVAFIKGMIGRFYFQFGISVAAAVLISLFVALTVTPVLCSRYLIVIKKHGRMYELLETMFRTTEEAYRKALEKICLRSFKYRVWFSLISFVGTLVVSALCFGILKKELITSEDRSDFFIQFQTPVGSSLEFSDRKMAEMEAVLRKFPEVSTVFAAVGGFQRNEPNRGMLFVQLAAAGKRKKTQQEVMGAVRKEFAKIPGLLTNVEDIAIGGVHGERSSPLQFDIKGNQLQELHRISETVVQKVRDIPGIVDVDTDMKVTKPEVRIYIDRNKAGDLGVDVRTIASVVNTLIGGEDVGKYKEGGKSYDVRVRLVPLQREKPEDISHLLVRTSTNALVQLSNVVQIKEAVGPDVINRKDRMRSSTIYGNLEGKTLGEALGESKKVAQPVMPQGYSLLEGGQAETMREAIASLTFAFVLAIVITYMVLASQFESFIHPFTIMLALPLSFIGALGCLLLTGSTLNVMSIIGMIMLMGLVTKNSILLVDYTNVLRSQGVARDEAVIRAAPVRLRPILMTAISTIAGVLPVALVLGAGGESRAPMAIATAGGMTTSTLLTLFIVPVVYMVLDDVVEKLRRRRKH